MRGGGAPHPSGDGLGLHADCLPHQLPIHQVMASDCMLIAFLISSPSGARGMMTLDDP
jgi:hypothetical protein